LVAEDAVVRPAVAGRWGFAVAFTQQVELGVVQVGGDPGGPVLGACTGLRALIQAVAGGIEAVLLRSAALVGALMQAGDQTAAAVVPVADGAVAAVLQLLKLIEGVVVVAAFPVQGMEVVCRRLQVAVLQAA